MTKGGHADGRAPPPPSRRRLLSIVAVGFAAATAIAVLFVLPAEFQVDVTGFGRLAGLTRLAGSGPPAAGAAGPAASGEGVLVSYPTPFRSDIVEIPLRTGDAGPAGSELEYKVRMKAGDSLVYSWIVAGLSDPEEFYYDFHGETPVGPDNPEAKVVEYLQATGAESHGLLVAPITGVHGWYLQNQSAENVVVRLRLSGFYELVPPGEYGNLAGIVATPAIR